LLDQRESLDPTGLTPALRRSGASHEVLLPSAFAGLRRAVRAATPERSRRDVLRACRPTSADTVRPRGFQCLIRPLRVIRRRCLDSPVRRTGHAARTFAAWARFRLANAPGICPSQCSSGPRVSAPFGVSPPPSLCARCFAAHVFGRAIRCCGSKPSRWRPRVLAPRASCAEVSKGPA